MEILDMDTTMSAAFDKAQAGDTEATTTTTETTTAAAPEKEAPVTVTETDNDITDQGNTTADNPAEKQPVEPPARWSAEHKAVFATLPREAQEILAERERDVEKLLTQKTQEIADQKRSFEQLETIIGPRRQAMQQGWGSEAAAVAKLFELSDFASRDPAGFHAWFAKQHNLTGGQHTEPEQEKYVDPAVAATNAKVDLVLSEIQNQKISEANRAIEAFKADPKNIYFNDVIGKMVQLIETGVAKDMQDAYDQAIYADPNTRAKILEAQAKEAEEKRVAEAKEAAAKAKRAASTNVSSKGSPSGGSMQGATMEDTMSMVYDRVVGAA